MPYDDPDHPEARMCFGQWVQLRSITEVERSGWPLPAMQLRIFPDGGDAYSGRDHIGCRLYGYTCPLCHLNLDSRQPEVERSSVSWVYQCCIYRS